MDARYLGGFIGDENPNTIVYSIERQSGRKHSYNHQNGREISPGKLRCGGFFDLIIMDILQCMTKYTGHSFVGVEKILQETYLPLLFFGNRNPSRLSQES